MTAAIANAFKRSTVNPIQFKRRVKTTNKKRPSKNQSVLSIEAKTISRDKSPYKTSS